MLKLEDILVKFQNQNPNIYIGGSVSLILQKVIPHRIPHDIDIITPNRIHIYELFNVSDKPKHRMVRRYRHNNLLFELFYNPKAEYIEYNWKGNILKLSPIEEIYQWKFKKENINRPKHSNDILHYNIYNKNISNE